MCKKKYVKSYSYALISLGLLRYLVRWEEENMMGMILTNLTRVDLTLTGQTEVRIEVTVFLFL